MDRWEYTLTGFGDFLDLRRVSFAKPMPATRVCGVCGFLPSQVRALPCGHVLCELCYSQIGESPCCPMDGREVASIAEVRTITFERSELEQSRVYCEAASGAYGGYNCGFSGRLSELRHHLTMCGGGGRCGKCSRPIVRRLAVQHFRTCPGDAIQNRVAPVSSGTTTFTGLGGSINDINALVKRVDSMERELRALRNRRGRGDKRRTSSDSATPKKKQQVTVITGPYRAASAPGVLIATCKFADVYAYHDSLTEDIKEQRASSDTYTLGGYTFRLDCEFSRDVCGMRYVRFILLLRDGEWDSYVEWPFNKKVTLIVMHLRDAEKVIRLPQPMDECRVVKRPKPGTWNWGRWTDKISWESVELRGFVDKGNLYVNVEFD